MTTRDDLDKELLRYLQEQKDRERTRDSSTISAISNLANEVSLLSQKMDSNHSLTQERISGLASRVDKLERHDEDTGRHDVSKLEAELKRGRDTKSRRGDILIGALFSLVASAVLGALAWVGHALLAVGQK